MSCIYNTHGMADQYIRLLHVYVCLLEITYLSYQLVCCNRLSYKCYLTANYTLRVDTKPLKFNKSPPKKVFSGLFGSRKFFSKTKELVKYTDAMDY